MNEGLHQLIAKRGFERFRRGLQARFDAHRLSYTVKYGDTPPNCSLFVRLESQERIGEVCAWESGDCEVQLAAFKKEGIECIHFQLSTDQDFHYRLADVFRHITSVELTSDET